ncbi:MAG: SurA N-terminal domain-containing protein, partial [Patescibacteria group bacterium]|nr:SurA N-terminal domain-containing protein [Patescibacteria group bacterium]
MAKAATKRTTKKTSAQTTEKLSSENSNLNRKSSPILKKITSNKVILVLGILIVLAILYLKKDLLIAATVNGQPITRISVVSELESQAGKQVLDQIVTKTLIFQEAKKQNVNVTQKDIDSEIEKLKKEL